MIRWARSIAIKLYPWERWLLIHGLELDDGGRHRFRTVLVLVARQNGKTLVKMVLTLYRLYVLNVRLIVGTAQDLSQAKEVMVEGLIPLMLDSPKLMERFDPANDDPKLRRGIWHKTLGQEHFRIDSSTGPRYIIKALNRGAGRGLWKVAEVNIDELREQTDYQGWASISKTVMAAEDAQIWCMSNAGDSSSLLLNHLRSVGLAGTDPQLFHAEWSAVLECELDDPNAWAQANPSLGYPGGLTEAAIRSALATDPPAVFRTEVLCQSIPTMNAAVDPLAWAACQDRGGSIDGLRGLALCVEVSQDGGHVVAVVAAELPGDGRVRLEVVGSWSSTQDARRALPGLRGLIRPKVLGWFPTGPGAALSATMRRLKAKPITGAAVAEACMTLADHVEGRRILQPGNPILDSHIAHTSKIGTSKMWEFDRSGIEQIHAAFGAAGATHLALNVKRGPARRGMIVPSDLESPA